MSALGRKHRCAAGRGKAGAAHGTTPLDGLPVSEAMRAARRQRAARPAERAKSTPLLLPSAWQRRRDARRPMREAEKGRKRQGAGDPPIALKCAAFPRGWRAPARLFRKLIQNAKLHSRYFAAGAPPRGARGP